MTKKELLTLTRYTKSLAFDRMYELLTCDEGIINPKAAMHRIITELCQTHLRVDDHLKKGRKNDS